MALPIFGIFLNDVYADRSIKISQEAFEKPEGEFEITMDCEAFDEQHQDDPDVVDPPPGIGR